MSSSLPVREQLVDLIVRVAEEENRTLPRPVEIHKKSKAQLCGPGSPLDSIGLVRLIVEIETAVEEKFGASVVLADERAMSQELSPFRTIGSLATYVEAILEKRAS